MVEEMRVYLKLCALKAVVSSPPVDHHINIQLIQGPLERLHLLALVISKACHCSLHRSVLTEFVTDVPALIQN